MITDLLLTVFQAVGLLGGLTGAVFVSSDSRRYRRLGFGVWIVANTAWVIAAVGLENVFMFVMFFFYLITAGFGARNACRGAD